MAYIGNHPKPIDLDVAETLRLLDGIVEEFGPDHKDPRSQSFGTCRYFDPNTGIPECIVGQVLHRRGFQYTDFPAYDDGGHDQDGAADEILPDGYVTYVLQVAQSVQDKGGTWGEAVERAKNHWEAIRPHTLAA